MTIEEARARRICCPMCDKKKCERNADDCDVNIHLKNKAESERPTMDIKVINAGNCRICGREIKIVATRGNNKFPNIFFCPKCDEEMRKHESEGSNERV